MPTYLYVVKHGSDEFIPTRASLLDRLKNFQDDSSWRDFFDTYWRLIYVTARRSGLNETDSQEIVQDTMIYVAEQMPEFNYNRKSGSFKRWLLKLTHWRIMDKQRFQARKARHVESLDAASESEDWEDPRAEDQFARLWNDVWEDNLIEVAFDRVRAMVEGTSYQIYHLLENKKMPPISVARALQVNLGRVYAAKFRVARIFKRELEQLRKEDYDKEV